MLLGKILAGLGRLELAKASKMSAKHQRQAEREMARAINARLEQGSMNRAAQVLQKSELAVPNADTMHKLAELHPHAVNLNVDVWETIPAHITAEILIKGLRRGSSAGLSDCTHEHVRAASAGVAMQHHSAAG